MTITTMSSREFNQDASGAKRASIQGPVFITDRGRTAHVLLSIEDYRKLTNDAVSLAAAVAQPGDDEADFEFLPPRAGRLFRPADLG
jgi:prevent-host-death family protein